MGETAGGMLRRGRDRLIGGVCSGLATAWHLDPLFVRVAAVILLFLPPIGALVVLLYIVLWLSMPPPDGWEGSGPPLDARLRMAVEEVRQDMRSWFRPAQTPPPDPSGETPPGSRRTWGWGSGYGWNGGGLWFGALLILLGLFFLGQNLGLLNGFRWDLFWPVVIIALGVLVLLRRFR